MTEETAIVEIVDEKKPQKRQRKVLSEQEKRKRKRIRRIRNISFGLIWVYMLTSIFFTNIDSYIIVRYNLIDIKLYTSLRLIVLILVIFLIWFLIGNKRFWKNFALFFVFPFYPGLWILIKNLLWKIPKLLVKRKMTLLLYYYAEAIVKFFVDFKYVILKFALLILGFIFMFRFDSWWLIIPIIIFSVLQIMHLVLRFKQTFSPIKIFKISIDELVEISQDPLSPEKLDETISDSVSDKNTDEEKLMKEMEYFLIISEFTKNLNLKIKEVINRRVYMLSFLGKTIYSFLLSMVFFGAINYCVFLLSPESFQSTIQPRYFDFFYYSFFTIFPDGTDIEPVTMISKSIRMIGAFIGILLNLLLLTVYLTISNERFKENLEKLLNLTDNYSNGINVHFKKKYGRNPSDTFKKLNTLGSTFESVTTFIKAFLNVK